MAAEVTGVHHSASNVVYIDSVSSWLHKHGKAVRPQLDRRQLDALRECFDIIDTDGTGTITVEELCSVFTVTISAAMLCCQELILQPSPVHYVEHKMDCVQHRIHLLKLPKFTSVASEYVYKMEAPDCCQGTTPPSNTDAGLGRPRVT